MKFASSVAAAIRHRNGSSDYHQNIAQEKSSIVNFRRPRTVNEVLQNPDKKLQGYKSSGRFSIKDFVFLRTLGTGTFARVWLVKLACPAEEDRDKFFALKVLRKVEVIKLRQIDHVKNERWILADVAGHPFITNLIASFSDHDSLYMLLEYCPGGEIFTYLRKVRRFNEDSARFYAAEIVTVFEFLHERKGVAYRDLKPENLLLDADGHVKLVDFGFGKILGNRETYTLCGTPEYLAPEVIQSKGHSTAVDWWALGILIYEFLIGFTPFWHHSSSLEIYKHILNKPVTFPAHPVISPEAEDIIRQLCTIDRSKRLGNISGGAARVKSHPFFRGVVWEDIYNRQNRGPIIPSIRYPGDAQCFNYYPDEKTSREPYSNEMYRKWENHFKDF